MQLRAYHIKYLNHFHNDIFPCLGLTLPKTFLGRKMFHQKPISATSHAYIGKALIASKLQNDQFRVAKQPILQAKTTHSAN